ncbi:hypothetical protein F3Y22_tig00110716pilonHSYRG00316 [Hibiscus syriacus]|uniref:Endonuclease V n=1 Tax=Hibiscus syriacus TaxID=106335 RepID=A0A6A2ZTV6_HIBSY|nr:hypothetical protein F3Y22_tig00110716pilonHSYRG00316 [Hibiscus syriacus]
MKKDASPFYPQVLIVDGFGLASQGSLKHVFVSIGHRVSLETAINIVNMTCQFRVPEPIRQ